MDTRTIYWGFYNLASFNKIVGEIWTFGKSQNALSNNELTLSWVSGHSSATWKGANWPENVENHFNIRNLLEIYPSYQEQEPLILNPHIIAAKHLLITLVEGFVKSSFRRDGCGHSGDPLLSFLFLTFSSITSNTI